MALNANPYSEFFASKIADGLYEGIGFTSLWDNTSEWITNGDLVHIPQYNSTAEIMEDYQEVGGSEWGFTDAGDKRLVDTDLTFKLKSHQIKPFDVNDLEDMLVNYSKYETGMNNQISRLREFKGKHLLYNAGKDVGVARTIQTTGGATSVGPDGTTGRLALTYSDIVDLSLLFDEDNVTEEDRNLLLPSRMYADLLKDDELNRADVLGADQAPIITGLVAAGKIAGINIYKKPTVLNMSGNTSGGTAVNPFVTEAKQSYHGGIAFTRNSVAYAMGEVQVYVNEGDAHKYGSTISAQVYGSANAAREDGKGIYIIAQGS